MSMHLQSLSGQEPYEEKGKHITLSNLIWKVLVGQRPKFTDSITEPMWELVTRCWDKDASSRPSFDEIFHELSTNFSLFNEDVDEDEIRDYLDYLADGRKDETDINERKKEFSLEYDQLIKRQEIEKKIFINVKTFCWRIECN